MSNKRSTSEKILSVSFIIPALNEATTLIRLLDSIALLKQSEDVRIHEVIVVDAKSSDGTAELAQSKGCKVISAEPGHVAISRNIGAAQATGNTFAFIDADCELPPNWLTAIAHELHHENNVAAGSRMAKSPHIAPWVEQAWYQLAHHHPADEPASNADWLATFNLAVKRTAFETTGGFDESLTTCEDVELGYRLSEVGELRSLNSCNVIHHGESKTISEFYRREAWRARGAFNILNKHWKKTRELISFLLPLGIIGGLFASVTLLLLCVISTFTTSICNGTIVGVALFIGPLPIMLLTLRRKVNWRWFAPCCFLMCVYFYARLQGTLRPFNRVERKG